MEQHPDLDIKSVDTKTLVMYGAKSPDSKRDTADLLVPVLADFFVSTP